MKRLYIILFCFLIMAQASAQDKKRKPSKAYNKQSNENEKFLDKQWWLGFKAGTNLSNPHVLKTYSVFSPTNYSPEESGKKYEHFAQLGAQATIEASFYFKGFYFSLQPTYQHSRFMYTNTYSWTDDEVPTNSLQLNYEQEQKVDHFIIPFLIKYDFAGSKLRPYVQIGAYSAILINANKFVTISGVDNASGGANEFTDPTIIVGAKDLFAKSSWGLIGGAGLNYTLGNVRLNLDAQYKYGMSNITSTKNRNSSDSLSGVGDILDDMTLDNLSLSIGCLFPMRFLANGFKSSDR
ncbi:MAG: porin family protein [Chryseolinea sp.]